MTTLAAENVPVAVTELPMLGSEDFGRFRAFTKSAMFLLGSGITGTSPHNLDFDYPDELIQIGARVFVSAIRRLCHGPI